MKANIYLIINRYQRSRIADRRPYVTLACEGGGAVKKTPKPVVDDEEQEVPIKRRGPYGTKKCGCLFKLKGEQMATSDNWKLFKIYNVVAKIKKNRMQGRNTVEEVLYLSAKWGLGSTTILHLYSNSHSPSETLFIGYLSEQQHFIQLQLRDGCPFPPLNVQWEFHRDIQLSGWEEPYSVQIADWVRQQCPLVRTRDPIYVEVD
ncbi:hypothetical protein M9H77_32291 [Catharanthus roseus]|uniref:Uncharacterized protein n=1 Tax=Catharanthus roseus TaxID=4058 RepID=A0ACC0A2V0_CATRO|nr:hypothetical protein M9H77_32291 [Catharanthus roseus]